MEELDAKQLKNRNNFLILLAVWLAGGILLAYGTYAILSLVWLLNGTEVGAWIGLFGGGMVLMFGVFMAGALDILYVVLFIRWLLVRKYNKPAQKDYVELV